MTLLEKNIKQLSQKTYGAIIPHAGIQYAGDCRKSAFSLLKDKFKSKSIKRIIYISAFHGGDPKGDKIYQFYKDTGFSYQFESNIIKDRQITSQLKSEHSFKWVHSELKKVFPDAKLLVLTPESASNLKKLSLDIYHFLEKHPNTLLLGTTDLSHVGTRFNLFYDYPQQNKKVTKEERVISYMINTKQTINDILDFKPYINMCGLTAVKLFLLVSKKMGWLGRVADYYDSYGISKHQKLDRYIVNYQPVPDFVSYASVVYGKFSQSDMKMLLPFDIYLGIGLSKSIIIRKTMNKNYQVKLPKWSVLNSIYNGIFVGTELIRTTNKKDTNCSYGRFQNKSGERMSILKKIKGASLDCPMDASGRWRIPYTSANLDQMTYKMEILDLEKDWKEYPALEAPKRFKYDGNHGIYLKTPNGSATYLPVVARENMNWSVEEYMEKLSYKASSNKLAWKNPNSIIKVYQSRSFIYDPKSNKIVKK